MRLAVLILCVFACQTVFGQSTVKTIVDKGEAQDVFYSGGKWETKDGALVKSGEGHAVYARYGFLPGDFRVKARLTIDEFHSSSASFEFDRNRFGFDGGRKKMFFVEGTFFGRPHFISPALNKLKPGEAFDFEVVRKGRFIVFKINNEELWRTRYNEEPVSFIGFRPWRSGMKIESFSLEGTITDMPEFRSVFPRGEQNVRHYRKPALLRTSKGSLLAFGEARHTSRHDKGDSDLVFRRSTDKGESWSKIETIHPDEGEEIVSFGTACPVQDKESGRIWLFYTRNKTDVLLSWSDDDGQSWAAPSNMTSTLCQTNWTSVITGPSVGIQLERGEHAGRLIVPAAHIEPNKDAKVRRAHVFYSDDQGKTWQSGGSAGNHTWEAQAVELVDGGIMMNMRNHAYIDGGEKSKRQRRVVATSKDGGLTWGQLIYEEQLQDPRSQASIVRAMWPGDGQRGLLLFSNPADRDELHWLTLRSSTNEGRGWTNGTPIHPKGSYSSLSPRGDGAVDCLFESSSSILFTRIELNKAAEPAESPAVQ